MLKRTRSTTPPAAPTDMNPPASATDILFSEVAPAKSPATGVIFYEFPSSGDTMSRLVSVIRVMPVRVLWLFWTLFCELTAVSAGRRACESSNWRKIASFSLWEICATFWRGCAGVCARVAYYILFCIFVCKWLWCARRLDACLMKSPHCFAHTSHQYWLFFKFG